jgi:hypothetical protein
LHRHKVCVQRYPNCLQWRVLSGPNAPHRLEGMGFIEPPLACWYLCCFWQCYDPSELLASGEILAYKGPTDSLPVAKYLPADSLPHLHLPPSTQGTNGTVSTCWSWFGLLQLNCSQLMKLVFGTFWPATCNRSSYFTVTRVRTLDSWARECRTLATRRYIKRVATDR